MREIATQPLATFCGNCNCGCPQLFVDPGAEPERRIRITDDFGQQVQMSEEQFRDLVEQAKSGALDQLTATAV
ncbi:hypothetical protein AB0P37_39105 [Streptomyces antimycoticus]|uniref:hypothetical protein n=1 Tax=Streptomyces antimycoticus TaxID=68175 RepID=UPI003414DE24